MARGSLPPGFRFNPTDVELVQYYLKRKVLGKRFHFAAISVVDMYEFPPWDLPAKACLKSRDQQWYFFCPRSRKYGKGQRVNRATGDGYWKPTGKDRSIYYDSRLIGKKKTLIFHKGKAPNADRTDWVAHEYRLEDKQLADAGIVQGTYVLCRVYKKSGLGPKLGEQYGAPLIEEDWEDNSGTEGSLFDNSTADIGSAQTGNVSNLLEDVFTGENTPQLEAPPIQGSAQTGNVSNLLEDISTGENTPQLEAPPIQETTPVQLELPATEESVSIQGEDDTMRFLCQLLVEENDSQLLQGDAPSCELHDPSAPTFLNLPPVDGAHYFFDVDNSMGVLSELNSESYIEISDLWCPLDPTTSEPIG